MIQPDPFATILASERIRRGLSAQAMADICGVTEGALRKREKQPQKNMDAWRRWANELGYEIVLRKVDR